MLLSLFLSLIFIVLGGLHFYWALGGAFGFSASLPTKATGERVLNPTKFASAIVGIGLTAFGVFYLFQSELIAYALPEWLMISGGWLIPTLFQLRAIGDFKYVGFFKSIKATAFAKLDTQFFSPLCLLIAAIGYIIQLLN
uniref:DUF3995 domain-containing protein n=1 Tax=Roseivirga sp. TaxID=1964215 RepID=UPI0040473D27